MKVNEIFNILNEYAPLEIAEEWDNVGLIIGNKNNDVNKILLALDCTLDVVKEAVSSKCNLIITHHPLIFSGIKTIHSETPLGKKLELLIKNDISVISMHTNLDKADGGVNDVLIKKIGGINIEKLNEEEYSLGRIADLKEETTLLEFVEKVKEQLNVCGIKYIGDDDKKIKRIAVVSGSGSEFYIDGVKNNADVFITSEVKHHIALEVKELDFAIIDAGHFETENIILNEIYEKLNVKTDCEIIISKCLTEVFKTL